MGLTCANIGVPAILLTSAGEESTWLLAATSPTNFCTAQKLTSSVSKLSLKFNCFPSHLDIRPWKNTHGVTSPPLPGGGTRRLAHEEDGKVAALIATEKTEARKRAYLVALKLSSDPHGSNAAIWKNVVVGFRCKDFALVQLLSWLYKYL